ncbi:MAG TPA: hypothetical protein VIM51_12310 [Desulfosporosinus sp.]
MPLRAYEDNNHQAGTVGYRFLGGLLAETLGILMSQLLDNKKCSPEHE